MSLSLVKCCSSGRDEVCDIWVEFSAEAAAVVLDPALEFVILGVMVIVCGTNHEVFECFDHGHGVLIRVTREVRSKEVVEEKRKARRRWMG